MNQCDKCHSPVQIIKVKGRFSAFEPTLVRVWTIQGELQVGYQKHRCPPAPPQPELPLATEQGPE
jgi:hypothetical protein